MLVTLPLTVTLPISPGNGARVEARIEARMEAGMQTRYLVPYRVRVDVIEMLRVFHSSRRLPDRW